MSLHLRIGVRLLLLLGWLCVSAVTQAEVKIDGGFTRMNLGLHWQVYEDSGLRLDADTLPPAEQWQAVQQAVPNFGFSDSAWWFRTRLTSSLLWQQTVYLQLAYPLLSDVDVYWHPDTGASQWFQAGVHNPLSTRAIANRHFLFPLTVPAKSSGELLLRVRSQAAVQVPATLMMPTVLIAVEERNTALLGISLGIPAVMLCYNLLLYLTVRERNYLYFTWHALTMLLFMLVWQGVSARYFLPENVGWHRHEIAFTAFLATIFSNWFAERYLGLQYRRFLLLPVYRAIRFGCVLMLFLLWWLPENVSNALALLLTGASIACVSVAVLVSMRTGGRAVRVFCLAWLTMLLGVSLVGLGKLGFLPVQWFMDDTMLVAIDLELLLISFALGDRINTERGLKLHAQDTALTQAEREKEARVRVLAEEHEAQCALSNAVDIQRSTQQTLESQVQERTQALEQAHQRLLALYEEDPLTGLKNRRYFSERLQEEFKRGRQRQQALAILLIDMDHFKRINDRLGHLQGDACIRHMARLLSACFNRAADCVARYGGEEFAVLIPQCDLTTGMWVAENLRQRVQQMPAVLDKTTVPLSISIGLVVFVPEEKHDVDHYLQLADDALYRAKSAGRNCVCHAPAEGSQAVM